jgi:dihydrofolate reductase
MAKLITWNMLSLDGFFEGPNKELDWFVFDEQLEKYILDSQMEVGALLFGRVTYQGMQEYWTTAEGQIAEFMNSVPKVVFSRTLDRAEWHNSRLVKANVPEEVSMLKQQTDRDIFVFGSADFTATLLEHGLVDELRIGLNPVLLGSGTPFFKGSSRQQKLKLLKCRALGSGLVLLHYQRLGSE